MSDLLFEVPRNKTRLQLAKEAHGIETHHCDLKAGEEPWIAIVRPMCVEALSGYGVTAQTSLFDMFAGYCRLMDEAHLIGYGETEAEAVLDVCRECEIPISWGL